MEAIDLTKKEILISKATWWEWLNLSWTREIV